jgi:hypothetical protein
MECPEMDDTPDGDHFLLPEAETPITAEGVVYRQGSERTLYYAPAYEIHELRSVTYQDGRIAFDIAISEGENMATAMFVSGTGIEGWATMQRYPPPHETTWAGGGPGDLSSKPAPPLEYRFRIMEDAQEIFYKGWITGYLELFPYGLSPASGSYISGPITVSWVPPPGGPYRYEVDLFVGSPFWVHLDVGANTSVTYSAPTLTPGWYRYFIRTVGQDGNCSVTHMISFYFTGP